MNLTETFAHGTNSDPGDVALVESGSIRVPRMAHRTNDDRQITARTFARLLARLHPDVEQAGQEYERLRRALVRFFDWRGAPTPDECADEAMDRLARKLEETIVDDVRNYAHGIARLILLERRRGPLFSPIEGNPDVTVITAAPPLEEDDRLRDCFDRCLADIPEEGRSLILRYYEGERHAKISNRRRLSAALGVSETALRSRVQRLRDRLEHCVQACVSVTK
jgi:DNA-directed RNA polymerase specialized sigma24 family protein